MGIRSDEPMFFSWLGVTVYLTEPTIDPTLGCMAKYPSGSEAVITLRRQSSAQLPARSLLADLVSEVGEPFVRYFTPEDFKDKLLEAGFAKVEFLAPAQSAQYFHSGENSLPNPKGIGVTSAIV